MIDDTDELTNGNENLLKNQLTLQQQRFCEEYLVDGNASLAYIRAGYKANNKSSAGASACRLLKKPNVANEIDRLRRERGKETVINSSRVLTELGIIAFSNLTDYVTYENGVQVIKPSIEWQYPQAVAEFNQVTFRGETKTSFKLHNKLDALNTLAKHAGLLDNLNVALNTFRRFGYEIEETENGIFLRDTYIKEQIQFEQISSNSNN
jgi:phage terminase small subunit